MSCPPERVMMFTRNPVMWSSAWGCNCCGVRAQPLYRGQFPSMLILQGGHRGVLMRPALLLLSCSVLSSSFGQTVRSNGGGGLEVSWLQGGHSQGVSAMTFSPDGQFLVTGANNGVAIDSTIKVWSVTDGTLLHTLRDDPSGAPFQEAIYSLDFSPDGSLLASGETNGRVSVWDASSWALTARFYSSGLGGGFFPSVLSIRFSPDGQLLAGASTTISSDELPLQKCRLL